MIKHAEILSKDIKVGSFVKFKNNGKLLFVEKSSKKDYDGIVEKIRNNIAWVQISNVKNKVTVDVGSASGFLINVPKVSINTTFKIEK